jgi:hypothetical protein
MTAAAPSSRGFRLPTGRVTVLLGPDSARRGVLGRLDAASARGPGGSAVGGVLTVTSAPARSAFERLAALARAASHRPSLVLVNRLTDGLTPSDRRTVLEELRRLAAGGPAVLVDDVDPVAALAVADGALRAAPDGALYAEDLDPVPDRFGQRGE